jgi:hypothetical protein
MSPVGVGYAVQRGEVIAREHSYQLIPGVMCFLEGVSHPDRKPGEDCSPRGRLCLSPPCVR